MYIIKELLDRYEIDENDFVYSAKKADNVQEDEEIDED